MKPFLLCLAVEVSPKICLPNSQKGTQRPKNNFHQSRCTQFVKLSHTAENWSAITTLVNANFSVFNPKFSKKILTAMLCNNFVRLTTQRNLSTYGSKQCHRTPKRDPFSSPMTNLLEVCGDGQYERRTPFPMFHEDQTRLSNSLLPLQPPAEVLLSDWRCPFVFACP